ncbi:hypothetical protein OBBRIDRAFT_828076 [Obba rivulosa]|uniref:F-box domain-containing protein n=1 Tax=Obba rivulosa TaxID=1052685 RepID=A0A8E2AUB0_9APHY|nr:hypothetical protein OBBRIDRAFT_828076 [Obba rivulosa]
MEVRSNYGDVRNDMVHTLLATGDVLSVRHSLAEELGDSHERTVDVEATDILRYLPPGIGREDVRTKPGDLPTEIWCIVLDAIDDPSTLFALASTCKLLMALAKQTRAILDPYSPWSVFTDLTDVQRLQHQVQETPLVSHFLMSIKIPAHSMIRFFYDFSGRLKALEMIDIIGGGDILPPLPRPILRAAHRFRNVTKLMISDVAFWSFADFSRLVCALDSLVELELRQVSWQRNEGRSLVDEPYAASLILRDIEIREAVSMSRYERLLGAPKLCESLTSLRLFGRIGVFCAFKSNPPDPLVPEIHETFTPSTSPIPRRTANIRIHPDPDADVEWGTQRQWLRECVDLLDSALASRAWCLSDIIVILHDCDDELVNIFRVEPLPFRTLRDRGILKVRNCKNLDMWNERWECEEEIIISDTSR